MICRCRPSSAEWCLAGKKEDSFLPQEQSRLPMGLNGAASTPDRVLCSILVVLQIGNP